MQGLSPDGDCPVTAAEARGHGRTRSSAVRAQADGTVPCGDSPSNQSQPARRKRTYSRTQAAAMTASTSGYPNVHSSSGMCSKFMP